MDQVVQALWRYVTGDSCDCMCGPDDGVHDPSDGIPCHCTEPPCHYCEGSAALTLIGVPVLDTGLCEEGRHYQQELRRLQAVATLPAPDPLPHPTAWDAPRLPLDPPTPEQARLLDELAAL